MRTQTLRLFALTAALAFLPTATIGWNTTLVAQELDIQGTWIRTSDDDSHQRGLLLFTPNSYSFMIVLGDEPRAEYEGDTMTDEEMLAAYGSFAANAGRYRLEGDQLSREAYMAKNPNYMAAWPDNDGAMAAWPDNDGASTVAINGDRLTLTFETPNGNTLVSTWRRPMIDGAVVR